MVVADNRSAGIPAIGVRLPRERCRNATPVQGGDGLDRGKRSEVPAKPRKVVGCTGQNTSNTARQPICLGSDVRTRSNGSRKQRDKGTYDTDWLTAIGEPDSIDNSGNGYDVICVERETGKDDDKELTIRAVKGMFPSLSMSNVETNQDHIRALCSLVLRLMKLDAGTSANDRSTSYKAQELCCKIVGRLPQRAFFQLLTRWARQKKNDFAMEAIYTLMVLNSHFPKQSMVNFLLNARDFKIQPTNNTRAQIHVSYVRSEKHEHIVKTIDHEIQLMYCGIATAHNVFFSKVRMDSVRDTHTFQIQQQADSETGFPEIFKSGNTFGKKKNPSDIEKGNVGSEKNSKSGSLLFESKAVSLGNEVVESLIHMFRNNNRNPVDDVSVDELNEEMPFNPPGGDDEVENKRGASDYMATDSDDYSGGNLDFEFTSAPQLGYHMPRSFNNRLWTNIRTLRLGYELFRIIFREAIKNQRLYLELGNSMNCRVLQFLFSSTAQRNTRSRYTDVLAQLAFLFPNLKSVEDGIFNSWVFKCAKHGKEHWLPSYTENHCSFPIEERCRRVVECYREVNRETREYQLSGRKLENQDAAECKYQTVRFLVFHYWLKFRANEDLKQKVNEALQRKTSPGSKLNRKRKTPTIPADRVPKRSGKMTGKLFDEQIDGSLPLIDSLVEKVDCDPTVESTEQLLDRATTVEEKASNPNVVSSKTNVDSYKSFLSREYRPDQFSIARDGKVIQDVSTQLFIETSDMLYCLDTAPVEIYLATDLYRFPHWRSTVQRKRENVSRVPGNVSRIPEGPHTYGTANTYISSSATDFFDKNANLLSVVRFKSCIFKRNQLWADLFQILTLCSKHGENNGDRHSYNTTRAMHFGIKGELKGEHTEAVVYGHKYFTHLEEDSRCVVRSSLRNVIDFIWLTSNEIQKELGEPSLGGNDFRNLSYASQVRRIFGARHSQFESVTVIHSLLSDDLQCRKHIDRFNDVSHRYSKTATMNVIAVDPNKDYHLLQIVCNFRRHVGKLCGFKDVPKSIKEIVHNIKNYHLYLRRGYEEKYRFEYADFFGQPGDLVNFYLDDTIPHQYLSLTPETSIREAIICLPIQTSRILSQSGFLAPVHNALEKLNYAELIEIKFFASFLSTPSTFNYSFREWIKNRKPNERPYFGISRVMREKFGSISSGIHFRFSPCNSSIEYTFGVESTVEGERKLDMVVESLAGWIDFIDGFLGKEDSSDIPLHLVDQKMKSIISTIKEKVGNKSLDFSMFRLSIFTSLAIGIGLTEPGKHLHQFFFPVEGSAAFNHLKRPLALTLQCSGDVALPENCSLSMMDENMKLVSLECGWKTYRRSYVEVNMCESFPGRYLNKKDLFVVGQNIFQNNVDGIPCTRNYGAEQKWIAICREHIVNSKNNYRRQVELL